MKARVIDKRAMDTGALVTFGSEILKIASHYVAPEHGTTTTSGMKLESASEGAPENTLTQQVLSRPKKTKTANKSRHYHSHHPKGHPSPGEFKVTKREAERAARRLVSEGTTPRRVARNMGTFAVLGPAVGTAAKGIAAAATSKGRRGSAALGAMKAAIKDKPALIEKSVGGAGMGAALTALSEGRDIRRSRVTVEKYLKETQAKKPTIEKLKAVL